MMKLTVNLCGEVFDFLSKNGVEFCMGSDDSANKTMADISANAVKLVHVMIQEKKLPDLLNVITGTNQYDGSVDMEEANQVVLDFFVAYRQLSTGLALAMMLPNPEKVLPAETPSGNIKNT
jgi:hypothetical protein